MIRCLWLVIGLMFSMSSWGEVVEVKAYLETVDQADQKVYQGDIITWKLVVWPVDLEKLNEIAARLKAPNSLQGFHIIEIESAQFSEHNVDALELIFSAIPTQVVRESYLETSWDGLLIPLRGVEIHEFVHQRSPIIVDGLFSMAKKYHWWLYFFVFMILAGVAGKIASRVIKTKRKKKERRDVIEAWKAKVLEASTREAFEEILSAKNKWTPLLQLNSQAVERFEKAVEAHQFKKTWTEDNFIEVKSAHEELRRQLLC